MSSLFSLLYVPNVQVFYFIATLFVLDIDFQPFVINLCTQCTCLLFYCYTVVLNIDFQPFVINLCTQCTCLLFYCYTVVLNIDFQPFVTQIYVATLLHIILDFHNVYFYLKPSIFVIEKLSSLWRLKMTSKCVFIQSALYQRFYFITVSLPSSLAPSLTALSMQVLQKSMGVC